MTLNVQQNSHAERPCKNFGPKKSLKKKTKSVHQNKFLIVHWIEDGNISMSVTFWVLIFSRKKDSTADVWWCKLWKRRSSRRKSPYSMLGAGKAMAVSSWEIFWIFSQFAHTVIPSSVKPTSSFLLKWLWKLPTMVQGGGNSVCKCWKARLLFPSSAYQNLPNIPRGRPPQRSASGLAVKGG